MEQKKQIKKYDGVNNLTLVENSLAHICFESERSDPSFFRIGRESHLVLYRSMIEALKGTANLSITSRPSKTRQHVYRLGNDSWKEIHKEEVKGCKYAWRFPTPIDCEEPEVNYQIPDDYFEKDDYLIAFYDTLAMIQADIFMQQYVMSKTLKVSDEEMKSLEWLHENVRNEYEHLIPKSYLVSIVDLAEISVLSLKLSKELLFESMNSISVSDFKHLKLEVDYLCQKINQLVAG